MSLESAVREACNSDSLDANAKILKLSNVIIQAGEHFSKFRNQAALKERANIIAKGVITRITFLEEVYQSYLREVEALQDDLREKNTRIKQLEDAIAAFGTGINSILKDMAVHNSGETE